MTDNLFRASAIIPGFNDAYRVTSQGDIYSVDRISANGRRLKAQIMTKSIDEAGFFFVNLQGLDANNGRQGKVSLRIHRLVGQFFVPNPNNWSIIGFKDNNRLHVGHRNIVWLEHKEVRQYKF